MFVLCSFIYLFYYCNSLSKLGFWLDFIWFLIDVISLDSYWVQKDILLDIDCWLPASMLSTLFFSSSFRKKENDLLEKEKNVLMAAVCLSCYQTGHIGPNTDRLKRGKPPAVIVESDRQRSMWLLMAALTQDSLRTFRLWHQFGWCEASLGISVGLSIPTAQFRPVREQYCKYFLMSVEINITKSRF